MSGASFNLFRKFKIFNICIAFNFLLSNFSFSQELAPLLSPRDNFVQALQTSEISIPREYGKLISKFDGRDNKVIINIQDAHCDYKGQKNIAGLIKYFQKNYNVNFATVEGADGIIDTSWFNAFPSQMSKIKAAEHFLKKGDITAVEYFSILNENKFTIFGAEDRKLYIENLNKFLTAYPHREKFLEYYGKIRLELSALKKLVYSEDLIKFDALTQLENKFEEYIISLQKTIEEKGIDTKSAVNFRAMIDTIRLEKTIDFNIVNKERDELLDKLSVKLSGTELKDLAGKSIALKSGEISEQFFYSYLKDKTLSNGMDLSKDAPNLYRFVEYLNIYSKVEHEKLFKEIDAVVENIKLVMFRNDEERGLDKLWKNINIIINIVDLKIKREDFDFYINNKEDFRSIVFTSFLQEKSKKYGITSAVNSDLFMEKLLLELVDFYDIAVKRDKALASNTLNALKANGQSIGILISGGFHTKGFSDIFARLSVSNIVIGPEITGGAHNFYLRMLAGDNTDNFSAGAAEIKSENTLQIPNKLCGICSDPAIKNEFIEKNREIFLREFVKRLVASYSEEYSGKTNEEIINLVRINFTECSKNCPPDYKSGSEYMKKVLEELSRNSQNSSLNSKKSPGASTISVKEKDEIEAIIKSCEDKGNYEDIKLSIEVMNILRNENSGFNEREQLINDLNNGKIVIRALDFGNQVGFIRDNPIDGKLYAYSKMDGEKIIIYVTKNFAFLSNPYYKKELIHTELGRTIVDRGFAMMAQTVAHEYVETKIGKKHSMAVNDEMCFLSNVATMAGVSDINLFILDQAAVRGDLTYLLNLLINYEKNKDVSTGKDAPFKTAVINALGKLFSLYLTEEELKLVHQNKESLSSMFELKDEKPSKIFLSIKYNKNKINDCIDSALTIALDLIKISVENALGNKAVYKKQDLRGNADTLFTAEVVYRLAKAYGTILREDNPFGKDLNKQKLVVPIGRDARVSGPRIMSIIKKGLSSVGVDSIDMVPNDKITATPIVGFALTSLPELNHLAGTRDIDGGIQITASHLEAPQNGIKMYEKGWNMDTKRIADLVKYAYDKNFYTLKTHEKKGNIINYKNLHEKYIEHVVKFVKETIGEQGLEKLKSKKIVVDPANGTGYIFVEILSRLGASVIGLYANPNGYFPNHIADPESPDYDSTKDLINLVRKENADIGVSFDSDADRVGFVTKKGKISGHELLMYLADKSLLLSPGGTVVFNNRTTGGIENIIKNRGGRAVRAPTGYTKIIKEMKNQSAFGNTVVLGGEESGHIMLMQNDGRDDGIFTAASVIGLLTAEEKSIEEIIDTYPKYSRSGTLKLTITSENSSVCEYRKTQIVDSIIATVKEHQVEWKVSDDKINIQDGLWVYFGDLEGWVLLRGSQTESQVFAVDIEAKDSASLFELAERIQNILTKFISKKEIDAKKLNKFIEKTRGNLLGVLRDDDGFIIENIQGELRESGNLRKPGEIREEVENKYILKVTEPTNKNLILRDVNGIELAKIPVKGSPNKKIIDDSIIKIIGYLDKAKEQNKLEQYEINTILGICRLIKERSDNGNIYFISDNIYKIFGFGDNKNIFVSEIFNNDIEMFSMLLFHEAGEAYFAPLSPEREAIIRKGLTAHTFLRGWGHKARAGERSISSVEENLRCKLGLADRLFGVDRNDEFTVMLRESSEKIVGKEVFDRYKRNPLSVSFNNIAVRKTFIYKGPSNFVRITCNPKKQEGGYIYIGFKNNMNEEEQKSFNKALLDKDATRAAEVFLNKIYVKPGDVFYITKGTYYLAEEGIYFVEIKNIFDKPVSSDITYKKTEEGDYRKIPVRQEKTASYELWKFLADDNFHVDEIRMSGMSTKFTAETSGTFHILACLEGSIKARAPNNTEWTHTLFKGDNIIIPAYIDSYEIEQVSANPAIITRSYIFEIIPELHPIKIQDREVNFIEIIKDIKEKFKDIDPKAGGKSLSDFRTNSALLDFIQANSVVKNSESIERALKGAYKKRGDKERELYEALFGDKVPADKINIVMPRGGRGGQKLTQELINKPNVRVTAMVAGTDDGRSWFYGAQEFDATGFPDARKCISDYLASTKPELNKLNESRFVMIKKEIKSGMEISKKITDKEGILNEFGKFIKKLENPKDKSIIFIKDSGVDEMWEHAEKVLNTYPGILEETIPYLKRIYQELETRKDDKQYKFSLDLIPFGSILMLGVKLSFLENSHARDIDVKIAPQDIIDVVLKLYGVDKKKFDVVTAAEKQVHLMGILADGTIYLTETGINEYERTASFSGLWYVDKQTVDELMDAQDINGVKIEKIAKYKDSKSGSLNEEIYMTVRKIVNPDNGKIKKIKEFFDKRNKDLKFQGNIRAVTAFNDADLVLLAPTTLFSNQIPSFTIRAISDNYKASRAVKIWFRNMAKDSCDPDGCDTEYLLEGISRSNAGTLDSYGMDNSWTKCAPQLVKYIIGNSPSYEGIAQEMPIPSDKKEYLPINIEELSSKTGNKVIPIGLMIEERTGIKTMRKDYTPATSYGFYSPEVMVDTIFTILKLEKTGFEINVNGEIIEKRGETIKEENIKTEVQSLYVFAKYFTDKIFQEVDNHWQVIEEIFTKFPSRYDDIETLLVYMAGFARDKYDLNEKNVSIVKNFYKTFIAYTLSGRISIKDERTGRMILAMNRISAQVLNIISWRERDVKEAGKVQLTLNAEKMVRAPDIYRGGQSFLDKNSLMGIPQANQVNEPGIYYRGSEGLGKLDNNIVQEAIYDKEKHEALKKVSEMYIMNHGWIEVPKSILNMTKNKKISAIHETYFITDYIPGSIQYTSTGAGRFQGSQLDIKYVTEGKGIQYNKIYNEKGELVKIFAQYLEPGSWTIALPGAVDSIENLGGLRFTDIFVDIPKEDINALLKSIDKNLDFTKLSMVFSENGKSIQKVPYYNVNINNKNVMIKNIANAPEITWIDNSVMGPIFKDSTLDKLYTKLTEPSIAEYIKLISGIVISSVWIDSSNDAVLDVADNIDVKYISDLSLLNKQVLIDTILNLSNEGISSFSNNLAPYILKFCPYARGLGMSITDSADIFKKIVATAQNGDNGIIVETNDNYTYSLVTFNSDFIAGKYDIQWEKSVNFDKNSKTRILFASKGDMEIKYDNITIKVREGEAKILLANIPPYSITAKSKDTIVYNFYKPFGDEAMVFDAVNFIKEKEITACFEEMEKREEKIILYVPKAMYKGDSFRKEKKIIEQAMNNQVIFRQYNDKEHLLSLSDADDFKKSSNVIFMFNDDMEKIISGEGADIFKDILNEKILALEKPSVENMEEYPFLREIEVAGIILGLTTKEDIEQETRVAMNLKTIMSHLSGYDITSNDLKYLVDVDSIDNIKRITNVLKKLLISVPMVYYKAEEEIKKTRQVLWAA
ncbi:secreted protein containing Alpha-D-phosphohexomutase, alpha/beta/alpha domain II [Candidatus Omnitrophus magneticus]|uniref:Secreted protein containing Alpha-D-phosphohexomutase, alpha/beta/alpha domain II n=1 Tax=Candidatus Omnitrophus magneticus TaxID=1609969 RepID=A0A0F0CJP7_9BACT|nr:secreted protein containing Alpha-D-phosphohexomutase, alpha/beta/alpha domain II [Candidatus Omnitrophus magneticus]